MLHLLSSLDMCSSHCSMLPVTQNGLGSTFLSVFPALFEASYCIAAASREASKQCGAHTFGAGLCQTAMGHFQHHWQLDSLVVCRQHQGKWFTGESMACSAPHQDQYKPCVATNLILTLMKIILNRNRLQATTTSGLDRFARSFHKPNHCLSQAAGHMVRFASNDRKWPFWLDIQVSNLTAHSKHVYSASRAPISAMNQFCCLLKALKAPFFALAAFVILRLRKLQTLQILDRAAFFCVAHCKM